MAIFPYNITTEEETKRAQLCRSIAITLKGATRMLGEGKSSGRMDYIPHDGVAQKRSKGQRGELPWHIYGRNSL